MDKPVFSDAEWGKIEEIVKIYFISKEMMIFGEQIDAQHRTQVWITEGYRHALDHLMRTYAMRFGIPAAVEKENSIYVVANLGSVRAHTVRAAYDAMDWVGVNILDSVSNLLEKYSTQTISNVLPKYYPEIRTRIMTIVAETFTEIRVSKDIGDDNITNLLRYYELVKELRGYFNQIVEAQGSLQEYELKRQEEEKEKEEKEKKERLEAEERERQERRKDRWWLAIVSIASAAIGAILGWLFTKKP